MVRPSPALETVTLAVGPVQAGAWSSGDVVLHLAFQAEGRGAARLSARGLSLPEPLDTVGAASLDCPRAEVGAAGIACARAELVLRDRDAAGEALRLPLAMALERDDDGWWLRLEGRDLAPGPLWTLAAGRGRLPGLAFDGGKLLLVLRLGAGAAGAHARLRAELAGLDFSDATGLHAGEGLSAGFEAVLTRAAAGWRAEASLGVDAGQLYLHPVFVDAATAPLRLSAEGRIDPDAPMPARAGWRLRHGDVVEARGTVAMDAPGAVADLEVLTTRTAADPVYRTYLQPFMVGTVFDGLSLAGEAQARAEWRRHDGWRVRVDLHDLGLDDRAGRFHLSGLDGRVDWSETGEPDLTRLAWGGGAVYRIDFGAGTLHGTLAGRRFRLTAPVRVPLLGGAVDLHALEAAAIGTPQLHWSFRGTVRPLSLAALSGALGWPAFDGTLGGEVPLVSYAGGVVTLDGSLDMKVFDGAVRIRRLSITDPFGVVPVLRADVDFDDLSLDALTRTFSFGNIQGRLQGRMHGLILKDWKPTAFDARFATPDDDDSRHRISQRAVENIASLGGAGAVLSTTFLRLFEEFSYRRLGISCRLRNGVCEMDGVAPAERGYYLVEGGGLPPRIDVLGFNRRVDWDVLLGRVRQIVTSEGPVVR